jgi:hypothetical protein
MIATQSFNLSDERGEEIFNDVKEMILQCKTKVFDLIPGIKEKYIGNEYEFALAAFGFIGGYIWGKQKDDSDENFVSALVH